MRMIAVIALVMALLVGCKTENAAIDANKLINPKEILVQFSYKDKEVHIIINDANLLDFRYINCTPEEGAKVVSYCSRWVADTWKDMERRTKEYRDQLFTMDDLEAK